MKKTISHSGAKSSPSLSDRICEDIYCEAVNYERFKPDLKNLLHERYSDLAVIYYLEKSSGDRVRTEPLTFERIAELGKTEEEIRTKAWKNTILKKRAVMMPLSEVVGDGFENDGTPLFVLTNEKMYLGAVTMLYPDLMDLIADELDSDLYIIPSSIHECLLLPEQEDISGEDLKNLIRKVNDTEVDDDEILSYNIYKYSRSRRSVTIDNGQNAMLSLSTDRPEDVRQRL